MSIEPISVRDFLRNFASIVDPSGKKKYLIMKHGKPIGMFTPWEIVKKETLPEDKASLSILEKY
ncbi:hypothetical protein COV05_01480 [Candidatus Uhrbacteria bacterium CG10_big_fil_rev_8_21_14_0_10_48_16]|uniref:Type II toxin-antitoxin system Phd/YefM family antitoxin n=1 Tax=Candidatus Uhrbacteria bacterium CG10_big_fil_rev_8_21_14_0_10_48_16 TaxID=1975038 RepID=A0A2M8LHZ3_9BACT|nr:MAG: hypothetical protein COV05_01480 [Candidatus Uhrbacteria bacterium CG10_big_fil_rev_8_21_14_0_10_48_16]